MAWPTVKPDSTKFDNANDSIAESRAELKTVSDNLNDIIDFIDTSGITNGQGLIYDSVTGTLKPGSVASGALTQDFIEVGDQTTTSAVMIHTGRNEKALILASGNEDSALLVDTPYILLSNGVNGNIALFTGGSGGLQINGNKVSLSTPAGYAGSVIGYWQVSVPGYGGAYIELKV